MKKNIITKALAGSVMVAASMSATAVDQTMNLAFTTLPAITITEVGSGIDLGTAAITGGANTTCTIGIDSVTPSDVAAAANTLVTVSLSGDGCVNAAGATGTAFAGMATIDGGDGMTVNVTVNSDSNADFTFTPAATVVQADGGATPVALTADTAGQVVLGPNGNTGAGIAHLYIGGDIVIGATELTAGTPYSTTYNVTVTY
jgi:hypothetical protein